MASWTAKRCRYRPDLLEPTQGRVLKLGIENRDSKRFPLMCWLSTGLSASDDSFALGGYSNSGGTLVVGVA